MVEKKGRRIEVRCSGPLPGFRTSIPGAYQSSVNGHWTVPLNMESCKLLRQKFGGRLKVGTELSRWAKAVRDNRRSMAKLAASKDASLEHLPKVAPKLAKAMSHRTYQRVGARFVADSHATLVADEPGLGKTLIAMGGVIEAQVPGPYLVVVTPKTAVRNVWQREIKRWLPSRYEAVVLPETRVYRERKLRYTTFGETKWLVVHPEMLQTVTWLICHQCNSKTKLVNKRRKVLSCKHLKTTRTKRVEEHSYPRLFEIEWGAIVVDECHESLIRRSNKTQRRNGLDQLKLRPDGIRIAMSGSPDGSMPHQLWGTLNWLDPKTYSAFYRWAELYWQKGGYTGFDIGEMRPDREPMLWDSLSSVAIRRTKAEVAKDLPPKIHIGTPLDPSDEDSPIGIWLPMEGEQARAYEQMLKHSAAVLDSGTLEALSALAELTRLKQLACSYGDILKKELLDSDGDPYYKFKYVPKLPSNKLNWLVENLEEWGYPSRPITKVVVVSFYTGILELFAKALNAHFRIKPDRPLSTMITGRVSDKQRDAAIQRFNKNDNEHIMFLNVKAGGTAITIDSADRTVFISETRRPHQQTQAEDRTHRVSNPRQCFYYYLRSIGTVDVGTALINKELAEGSRRLLDVRRGVEYTRHVIDLSS